MRKPLYTRIPHLGGSWQVIMEPDLRNGSYRKREGLGDLPEEYRRLPCFDFRRLPQGDWTPEMWKLCSMCPSTETATSNCTFEDYAALASRLDVLVIPPYECYA